MEVAGLVIGVAALWESCVQIFEVVNLTREYGMDYEILSVKLEVERVRLLSWGHAVGLSDVANNADTRLKRIEIHTAVVRLLGCIQHVFENSERLQNTYGLRPNPAAPEESGFRAAGEKPSQSQLILGGIFKRAYENLRRVALERQRNTHIIRKSHWAVYDRKKFMELVTELRGFNDSLESLFPDAKLRIMEVMQTDIDEAIQIRDLQLLQQATAGEQGLEDISERASSRLEALGATVSARTDLLSDSRSDLKAAEDTEEDRDEWPTLKDSDVNVPCNGQAEGERETTAEEGQELDELSKKLRDIELYVQKKSVGALTLRRSGPSTYSEHCSAYVYWDGDKSNNEWTRRGEREKGFVPMLHASFDLYKKKKYMKKSGRDKYDSPDSEDYVLLDPESHIKFENVNAGTVTVEGYGLECWDFESQKPRDHTIRTNTSKLPTLLAKRLLRRIDELQTGSSKFGWNPDEEELNLKQFVGTLGITYLDPAYEKDTGHWIGDLYSVLNRTDIFANFTEESSVALHWATSTNNDSIGTWNFLRQIVVAWELTMRLEYGKGTFYTGFTARILASLIISDLWLKYAQIILRDATVTKAGLKKAETALENARAEEFKTKGDEAWKRKEYQVASDLYTEAMKIDLTNAVYRCNRAAAQLALEKWMDAEEDAYIATNLDPKYAKAWSRLGMARLKLGQGKQAKKAYEKALQIAGKDSTAAMQQGLADAKTKIDEAINAIKVETDKAKRHALRSDFLDEDFEIYGKVPEFHSLIHAQQVEGLLSFAEKMKWPCINEVRDYAEDVYNELRGGGTVNIHLLDWLFGVVLPGKWFAFKIMTALIFCTPSIRDTVGIAHYYECGFSHPTRSYWRCRTVLGRVLGCLPGVQGLCGWIGPCPPVDFDPLPEDSQRPRHIRISARRITPFSHTTDINDRDRIHEWEDNHEETHIQPNEEINPYIADMKDSNQWIIPEPPVRDIGTCQLKSIKLRKLPLETKFASQVANGIQDLNIENETQYRANLEFTMDNNPNSPVTYKLLTNPVFVTPPPCRPGPKGPHEVHMRELPRYQRNIWSIERLKDHTNWDESDSENEGVMIINATGKGSEVLARAWCSERGRNAIIRRAGGPCFVCAVRAAGKRGLGLGTLIWVG